MDKIGFTEVRVLKWKELLNRGVLDDSKMRTTVEYQFLGDMFVVSTCIIYAGYNVQCYHNRPAIISCSVYK